MDNNLKGSIYVVADHSHTDTQKLQKVISRYQKGSGDEEYDAQRMYSLAYLHAEELRNAKGSKTRHACKKVFIVKVLEVIDVIDSD